MEEEWALHPKSVIVALAVLLMLSLFVVSVNAAAEGTEQGEFPNRIFNVTRSPPGGPKSDTFIANITPPESGYWSVRLDYLAGAAIIVQVYHVDGGVPVLAGSSKLRSVGQTSTEVPLLGGAAYQAWFIPYGKAGTSVLSEQWRANQPPVACFTFSPTSPFVGVPVSFDASCSSDPDGTIVSYDWDFGDGGTATGVVVSHTYAAAGTYTVTLRVTDNLAAWDTEAQAITVAAPVNRPPVALFTWTPAMPKAGIDTVQFDASASYDPDGMIVSYAWDFGDGSTGAGVKPTHLYAAAGDYVVTLTVTDDGGLSDSLQQTIHVVENQPPVVSFTWSPSLPKATKPVSFDASASYDPDGTIVDFHWVWGDGSAESTGTSPLASHTYAAEGTYTVTLHATDDSGAVGALSQLVTVAPILPPTACFVYSPTSPFVGVPVSFDASCSSDPDGTIVSYDWDFGDGGTATGVVVSHTYAAAGTYTVTLTVTDDDGASGTASVSITVQMNQPPVAVISYAPPAPMTLEPVTFDGTQSYDPDGRVVSYLWLFGDDGSTQSGAVVTHTFLKPGIWKVTLTVTDDLGAVGSASVDVSVGNRPPVAILSVTPTTGYTYELFTADGSASYDPDGMIVAASIDWGDGTVTSGLTGTHAYTRAGTYTITLTVTDDSGASATDSKIVTVLNQAPRAVLSVSPLSAYTGDPFTADGSASSDPDGTIVAYEIDWGDGSPPTLAATGTHAYADNGVYTITLTVTDDLGATSSASVDVTVLNRPPVAAFTYSRASESYKDVVLFDASGSSDPDGRIVSYAWDFGDGGTASGVQVSHRYAGPGTYLVTLTVTDDDGATGSQTQSLSVVNLPPVAVLSVSPVVAKTLDPIQADGSASFDPEGGPLSYRIDWGDGSPPTLAATGTHAYADNGVYTITLTVTDAFAASNSATQIVTIENRPPTAMLSVSPLSATTGELFTATGTASDLDGTIVAASIDWGDGNVTSGLTGTHAYSKKGDYLITLTVTDDDGATGSASVSVAVLNRPPIASFTWAVRSGTLTVDFDASASYDPDGTIVDFHWVWGDGSAESTGTSPLASHTYAAEGTYTVTLHVTDDDGGVGAFSDAVVVPTIGPPPTGISWRFYDFFAVPYGEWWDMRTFFTADHPVNAECFSVDGITYGWCFPADPNLPDTPSYPYTNWVPGGVDAVDGSVFAPYRFTVDARGLTVYSMDWPVILPTCEQLKAALEAVGKAYDCPTTRPTGGSVLIQESIDYLTTPRATELRDVDGCPDVISGNDGFLTEMKLTLTMDAAAAARLFGVTDGTMWTPGLPDTSLISTGCGPADLKDPKSGRLERAMKYWLDAQGGVAYDVYNVVGAEWLISFVQASGLFDAASGKHVLTIDIVARDLSVLTSRWFYWGATTYADGVSKGAAPAGWWGMEPPFLEELRMTATIGTDPSTGTGFDASVSGVIQDHFRHLADPGADGLFRTPDDVPKWVWMPILADRYPKSAAHPNSELTAYAGYTYVHSTPGSVRYGTAQSYDYAPALWPLRSDERQRFEFPTSAVVLYDPILSGLVINDPSVVVILEPIATTIGLAYSVPASGVGVYDPVTNVLTVTGPTDLGTVPTTPAGKPLESRPIYNLTK